MNTSSSERTAELAERFRKLPTLYADASFWAITLTGFFGAFNDNLFKQLLLLLSVPDVAFSSASAAGTKEFDLQPLSMFWFALPFVLFSGYAGVLSDRFSKSRVVWLSKFAEIGVMLLGVPAFFAVTQMGLAPPLAVLFLMGAQSAFYGPAKYGILPELLRPTDLARATGVTLMATFLSIIFGTAAAGLLKDAFPGRLDLAQWVCVVVAVVGTLAVLPLRRLPAAQPALRFSAYDLFVPRESLALLRHDGAMLRAMFASCSFWLAAAIVQMAVNSFGKVQLALSDTGASLLAASIGVGIAFGSIVAGSYCSGSRAPRAVQWGIRGLVAGLAALCVVGLALRNLGTPEIAGLLKAFDNDPAAMAADLRASAAGYSSTRAIAFGLAIPLMTFVGFATGMFAVPVQVFLQQRPPDEQKGRMIAAQAVFNWIAIFASAGLYFLFDWALTQWQLPRCWLFACTSLLMLPIAVFYRLPENDGQESA